MHRLCLWPLLLVRWSQDAPLRRQVRAAALSRNSSVLPSSRYLPLRCSKCSEDAVSDRSADGGGGSEARRPGPYDGLLRRRGTGQVYITSASHNFRFRSCNHTGPLKREDCWIARLDPTRAAHRVSSDLDPVLLRRAVLLGPYRGVNAPRRSREALAGYVIFLWPLAYLNHALLWRRAYEVDASEGSAAQRR